MNIFKKGDHVPYFVFVVGGVMSGVGKGITTASLGKTLQARGKKVSLMKADPYLNVDAGTMNPTEHGEVFVLNSGLETDQDMGNYERFLNTDAISEQYMTNGMVFKTVIDKERRLEYEGKCVEPTYHITQEILRRMHVVAQAQKPDVCMLEIGGTIGEYQNAIFLEAARWLKLWFKNKVQIVLVSYLPTPAKIGEMKTKPTQNAVRQLNSYGLQPDFIVGRAGEEMDKKRIEKLHYATGVLQEHIIPAPDIDSIYQVPLAFEKSKFAEMVLRACGEVEISKPKLSKWKTFLKKMNNPEQTKKIAVVGKYFTTGDFVLSDAYVSVLTALKISAAWSQVKLEIDWLDAASFEKKNTCEKLSEYAGVVIPGGFGTRGIEGKINVLRYTREHGIPTLGLCYGVQLMAVEAMRTLVGKTKAHTTEVNAKTPDPVVTILNEQLQVLEEGNMGGTMRLGAYECVLQKDSLARSLYKKEMISERHRHRYEVNPAYYDDLKSAGFILSGIGKEAPLVEILELPQSVHPFYLGVQFHPEFLARPESPHPLFNGFVQSLL